MGLLSLRIVAGRCMSHYHYSHDRISHNFIPASRAGKLGEDSENYFP